MFLIIGALRRPPPGEILELLTNLAPMPIYNLLDDGYGNRVIVRADSWAAAYYHVHGRMV